MRGKRGLSPHRMYRLGITPAHAGKTTEGTLSAFICRDHPRACGENKFRLIRFILQSGSPPRMRGKLKITVREALETRITPAHAGKTAHICPTLQQERDHPRGCGENLWVRPFVAGSRGSPPRMRGKLIWNNSTRSNERITPADAGKTPVHKRTGDFALDHPRGCGENYAATATISLISRITPAGAGKTLRCR